jgi:hypothetical protein
MRMMIIAVIAVLAGSARAGDYPTDPEKMDRFCEAIGQTPNIAVPPRDRLWLSENCICLPYTGCGHMDSKRFGERMAVVARAQDVEKKEREQKAAAAKVAAEKRRTKEVAAAKVLAGRRDATAELRTAYWECSDREDREGPEQRRLFDERSAACYAEGRKFFDECYSTREGLEKQKCEIETSEKRHACFNAAQAAYVLPPGCKAESSALEAACEANKLDTSSSDRVFMDDCYRRE